jgi:hypothetical protein
MTSVRHFYVAKEQLQVALSRLDEIATGTIGAHVSAAECRTATCFRLCLRLVSRFELSAGRSESAHRPGPDPGGKADERRAPRLRSLVTRSGALATDLGANRKYIVIE